MGAGITARAALVSGRTLARGGRLTGRGTLSLAAETFRFARDVRDGMELYKARHPAPTGSTTLGAQDHEPPELEPPRQEQREPRERARRLTTNHDVRPKDGR